MIEQITMQGNELSIFMPLSLKKRGGYKMVLVPEGKSLCEPQENVDHILIKALVRAHLWQRQLKSGKYQTTRDLAAANKLDFSYVKMILRLNLLAPKIKEAILKGQQPRSLKLIDLKRNIPLLWLEQGERFGVAVVAG